MTPPGDPSRHVSSDDLRYLDLALEVALQGRGRVHPNPMVGAVLVRDGAIVGRGAHLGPGLPHAEVVALRQAGPAARGAALYCTLEPCSHQGRTPPCADAIIAAGVSRVVVAMEDPHPVVDGRGLARLSTAGLEVVVAAGEAGCRARELNRAYLKVIRCGLPWVTYKAAVSLDGKVAARGGDARWLSSEESRALVHLWRSQVDAVLIGGGTLRRDDPLLTVRALSGRDPVRVVMTRHGDLPIEARLFETAQTAPVIVLAERIEIDREAALIARGVTVRRFGGGLSGALKLLADTGLLDVLCEGGPGLFGGLLDAGLVDRVALFLTPRLLGAGAPELLALPAPTRVGDGVILDDVEWRQVGRDLLLEGRPQRRSAPAEGSRGEHPDGAATRTTLVEGAG
ncbi:MAG: bifunctional diaminohydroxyphosphoribosylaminopyrimidine deaminase/5-amino-6-(5-phosphoribosylamino)uracil reductase RibD [Actinobacteria bacterium]|nr:bifunctional diaminohydroxyphosphoribosylaminopyrimidine deaminase/5-amino-6-(5-phosphoribosylamino)uracil reductase RibD [Actinomycetota bacterium]